MIARLRTAAAVSAVLLSTTALAADLNESAMAGDPTWPSWMATVSPSAQVHQTPAVDPNLAPEGWPAASVDGEEGLALWQQPIVADPLQGNLPVAVEAPAHHASGEQRCPGGC